ncbi:MAG: hypothetical protein JJU36_08295, partial [Phycisphaeraceae bacterium]|nr:hypothetical protein [Phycisphaeraceae bacterium]
MSRYRVPKMTVTAAALLIGACAHDRFDDRFIDWRERLSRADMAQVDVQIAQIEYQPSDDAPPDLPRLDAQSGPVNLSIEQAVALALEHHPGLAAQRLGPAIAGTFERIELARFDPVVFAELDWRREQRTETRRATGENFDVSSQGAGAL